MTARHLASDQRQPGDVLEVLPVQRPEGRALRDRAGGDGEVELPGAGAGYTPVELGGERGLAGPEGCGRFAREEQLLRVDLLAAPPTPKPLVQHRGADRHQVATIGQLAQLPLRSP